MERVLGTSFFIEHLSYAGFFMLLAGAGVVIPLPEEVTLLTMGYLSANGVLNPIFAGVVALLGMLLGDSILFWLARSGVPIVNKFKVKLDRLPLHGTWIFHPDKPLRAVFFLRFITGLRMIAPVYAALRGARFGGFLAVSFASLCIYTPLFVGLGFAFHQSFLALVTQVEIARHALFALILIIASGGVFAAYRRFIRTKNGNGTELTPP